MSPFKSLRNYVLPPRSRFKVALPAEIWVHILSFLDSSEIMPFYRMNRLFYTVAMDSRYRHISFCDQEGFVLWNACSRDVQLKKRIKSVSISNDPHIYVDEELGISPQPAQAPSARLPVLRRITSMFSRKAPEYRVSHAMPSAQILEHFFNVLDGADNLEELRIIRYGRPTWESSSLLVHPLCAALSNRKSLRKLYVMEYRLDLLLPVLQFKGLTSLIIIDIDQWSMDALPSFVEHVAPSIEILYLDAVESIPPSSLSHCMAQILCDNALTMPNLRELTTHLTVSPDPMSIFHAISTRCRSLTKLDLYISVESSLNVPLNSLTLPCLRILYLSFGPNATIVGLWDGQCGLAALDEFRIKGRYLRLEELDSMGRFFSKTTLVSLSVRVFALDGPVLRVLANHLPMLRNLDLFADHLLWLGLPFSERAMAHTLAQLTVDVQGRGLEGWGLAKLFFSLDYDRIPRPWRNQKLLEPPQEAASILTRCIPSIRTTKGLYYPQSGSLLVGFSERIWIARGRPAKDKAGGHDFSTAYRSIRNRGGKHRKCRPHANLFNCLSVYQGFEHEASRVRCRSVTLSNKQLADFRLAIDSNPENSLRVVSLTIRGVRFESPDPYHNLDYILSKSHGAGDASDQLELGALRRVPRARCALPVGADDVDLAQQ
ncbi:hypothetical protein AB1N83_010657 [Pleurotus pulmonarius]